MGGVFRLYPAPRFFAGGIGMCHLSGGTLPRAQSFCDKRDRVTYGEGSEKVIALRQATTKVSQGFDSFGFLKTFGNNIDIQLAAQGHQHPHDALRDRIAVGVTGKGTIDLERRQRQVLQIAKVRISRAEIIDGYSDTKVLQPVEIVARDLGGRYKRRFRHL